MIRQRLRAHESPLRFVGRLVLVIVSLLVFWYGAMLVALAFKVSPDSVERLSGYRSAFDFLAGLEPDDVSGTARLVVGLAGVAAFLVFGFLALKEIPRPYLARAETRLREDARGRLVVEPRAIERAVEAAASSHAWVSEASARYGDDALALAVTVDRSGDVAGALRELREQSRESLMRHELPLVPVNVELAGFESQRRREFA